jgi:hypothetical protein
VGEVDDYAGSMATKWLELDSVAEAMPFYELPFSLDLKGGQTIESNFRKGSGDGDLILYFPQNKAVNSVFERDKQSQRMPTKYLY